MELLASGELWVFYDEPWQSSAVSRSLGRLQGGWCYIDKDWRGGARIDVNHNRIRRE